MEDNEENAPNLGGRPRRDADKPQPLPALDNLSAVARQLNRSRPTLAAMIKADPAFAACFITINNRRFGVRPKIAAYIEKRQRSQKKIA